MSLFVTCYSGQNNDFSGVGHVFYYPLLPPHPPTLNNYTHFVYNGYINWWPEHKKTVTYEDIISSWIKII